MAPHGSWPPGDGEMARRIREHDWAATPLGPIDTWSDRLQLTVEQVLASSLVSTVVCGPERILIYNDVAAPLYGDRHPGALGGPMSGNEFAQVITGNAGANTIHGMGGADELQGRAGNDHLDGGVGNDRLRGDQDDDKLTGGLGNDRFLFWDSLKTAGVDTITDFSHQSGNNDTFSLYTGVFHALGSSVSNDELLTVTSGHAAKDGNDHLIYNKQDGTLWYDADGSGSGGAVHFATMSNHVALTYHDFSIFVI